ncbi:MAG TPA: transposase, partial [Ktedonobacterales bacterium]
MAAEQICSWLRQAGSPANVPIFTVDAGYDAVQFSLALAHLPVCLLVRLRASRYFSAGPATQPQTGRPRRHGAKFVCDDPATWPTPTKTWSVADPDYGRITVRAWSGVH